MGPAGADVLTGQADGSTNLGQFTAYDAKTGTNAFQNRLPSVSVETPGKKNNISVSS
jgi:hypothetical protein